MLYGEFHADRMRFRKHPNHTINKLQLDQDYIFKFLKGDQLVLRVTKKYCIIDGLKPAPCKNQIIMETTLSILFSMRYTYKTYINLNNNVHATDIRFRYPNQYQPQLNHLLF